MKPEERELLFKDLCSRLPYGVKLQKTYETSDPIELYSIDLDNDTIKFYKYKGNRLTVCTTGDIERFGKLRFMPYLFPFSSMTEEQQKEANIFDDMDMDILSENLGRNHRNKTNIPTATYNYIDWLNENHFDYRGLIEKGLAIDATGKNIY